MDAKDMCIRAVRRVKMILININLINREILG